jgi:hypothetical protein
VSSPLRTLFQSLTLLLFLPSLPLAAQGDFQLEDWPDTAAELKPMFVKAIIEQAKHNNAEIKLPASFYQTALDDFAAWSRTQGYRQFLKVSVAQNLATLAVIHCDWHNDAPALEFAQRYLGDAQLQLLSTHYPNAINRLKAGCKPD